MIEAKRLDKKRSCSGRTVNAESPARTPCLHSGRMGAGTGPALPPHPTTTVARMPRWRRRRV